MNRYALAAVFALLLGGAHLLDGPGDLQTMTAVADDVADAQAQARAEVLQQARHVAMEARR